MNETRHSHRIAGEKLVLKLGQLIPNRDIFVK